MKICTEQVNILGDNLNKKQKYVAVNMKVSDLYSNMQEAQNDRISYQLKEV
jgi:hypothetical protein